MGLGIDINWVGVLLLLGIYLIYLLATKIKATKNMKKMGISTEGLVLFSSLKNYVTSLQDNEKQVWFTLFHNIILSETAEERTEHARAAVSELEHIQKGGIENGGI